MRNKQLLMLIVGWMLCGFAHGQGKTLPVTIQKYDSATGKIIPQQMDLNPAKTAIIVIDMWNYHWCMTCCERVSAMVPRMNAVLDAARRTGIQVIWNPSDVVTLYSGHPAYERGSRLNRAKCRKYAKICVFGKPGALSYLWKAGFNCLLARDLNDAFTHYDPAVGYTLDTGTDLHERRRPDMPNGAA